MVAAWLRVLILGLVAAAMVAVTSTPAGGETSDSGPVVGSIDVVRIGNRTSVVGWVSAGGARTPRVQLVVDDRIVRRFRPSLKRFDVGAALRSNGRSWGFDVKLRTRPERSVCLSVRVDGDRRGIDCWYRDGSAFAAALGGGAKFGKKGRVVTYSVEVEGNVRLHPEEVARDVDRILGDKRSWSGDRRWRLRRVRATRSDVRIILATPRTVDRMCAPLRTGGRLSCRQGNRVIMNSDRWRTGVAHWTADLDEYRAYLVNHEVGHFLGFAHAGCGGPGRVAPVMMQQTKSLAGCKPNGWPRA